jgi:hypothetical protein
MAHAHDTYHHDEGVGFGIVTGFMLMIAAILAAAVIAGIALLVAQPWDDDGGSNAPSAPVEQPVEEAPPGDIAPEEPGQ